MNLLWSLSNLWCLANVIQYFLNDASAWTSESGGDSKAGASFTDICKASDFDHISAHISKLEKHDSDEGDEEEWRE